MVYKTTDHRPFFFAVCICVCARLKFKFHLHLEFHLHFFRKRQIGNLVYKLKRFNENSSDVGCHKFLMRRGKIVMCTIPFHNENRQAFTTISSVYAHTYPFTSTIYYLENDN